jgi:hypothetical protein
LEIKKMKNKGKTKKEISQNKGILYNPGVVDACLRLFKEKEFKFESQGLSRLLRGRFS